MGLLDMRALFVTGLMVGSVGLVLQLAFWLRQREPALFWWASANGIGAAGALLFAMHGDESRWLFAALGNTLIFVSGGLLWSGMRSFAHRPAKFHIVLLLAPTYFVAQNVLPPVADDTGLRVLLGSSTSFGWNLVIAWELAADQRWVFLRVRAWLAALFGLHALWWLFRAVTALTLEPAAQFLAPHPVQLATVAIGVFKAALWNVLVIAMLWERSQRPWRPTSGSEALSSAENPG